MATENKRPPETAQAGTHEVLLAEIQSLRNEIDSLESRINSESKGSFAWAKKWEVWLAVITAVFALPRGGLDVYHLFRNRPDSRVISGNTLLMAYQPAKSRLEFTFGFSASNTGTEDDLLDLRGNLTDQGKSSNDSWPFSAADFSCSSLGAKLPIPFAVRAGLPISIECSLSARVDPAKSRSLFQPGNHRLAVTFLGAHNRNHSMDFCFYLTNVTIDEVFGSSHQGQRRFIYPHCDAPAKGE